MPIASGASGRVDVGVDTSKRWAPDGLKDQPVFHQYDSYLLQYQELKQIQNKTNSLQRAKDGTHLDGHTSDGSKKDERQKTGSSRSLSSGRKTSKTSKLCVVL
uniref:Uncharacterized protein n=1 Tax=Nothobranchius pienaari TaxID=704102 RepID=A0A1A8LE89_9TELE